ncbi:MAG TPA: response regulator, partial [Thermoguttaceae bacterium]|nr:response regulator [Thermoguttaceae bacterium]
PAVAGVALAFGAADGEEAVQIVRRQEVHLVLLDVHMPKLTGLEVLRLLREFNSLLPIILLSAGWDDWLLEQAQQAQAFSVLPKPVGARQLTVTVCQALKQTYNWSDELLS